MNVLIAFYDSQIGVKIEINKLKIVVRIKTFFSVIFQIMKKEKVKFRENIWKIIRQIKVYCPLCDGCQI